MNDACARYRRSLFPYSEGELGRDEGVELETHLAACAACRLAVEGWRRDPPRFGEVKMPAAFWESRPLPAGSPPARGWLDSLLAPMAVPRAVALACGLALSWLLAAHLGTSAGPEAAPHERAPRSIRALGEVEGVSRVAADLG